MKDEDRQRLLLAARRKRAIMAARGPGGLLTFAKLMSPAPDANGDPDKSLYVVAKHHELIAKDLEDVAFDRISHLVETLPPRHGKSRLVSIFFVAWYMGLYPGRQVIVATYNDDFAASFGSDVKGIIDSPVYRQIFPKTELIVGGKSKSELITTEGGKVHFAGRGGSLTGTGAHLLVLDDIIKDSREANSPTIREQTWDWMLRVAFTRRMGSKSTIMTWTRWHVDDPIGRMTDPNSPFYNERTASRMVHRNYPALCIDENDGTGRKIGEALWPGEPHRLDEDYLLDHRALDPVGFEAMYQGNPILSEGSMFSAESVSYYDPSELPDDLIYYAASDHAVSERTRADSTVLIKGGVDGTGTLWVTDVWWQRASTDKVAEAMMLLGAPPNAKHRPIVWWAESGQALKGFLPFLQKRMRETGRIFNIRTVNPSGDKVTRAQSISARMALGMVKFPKGASWTERAVAELTAFPAGRHDDFVDALSHLGLGLADMFGSGSRAAEKKPEPVYGSFSWLKKNLMGDNKPAGRLRRTAYER